MNPRLEITAHLETRIYPILVAQVYKQSNIGIIASIVNAAIFAFISRAQVPHGPLVAWLVILLAVSLVRTYINARYHRAEDRNGQARRWALLQVVGLGIAGGLWGSTAIFLFPHHSVAHQVFIAFLLAGMVGGAVGAFSPLLPLFMAFSIPALVPIIVRFMMIGDSIHVAMGSMITLFAVLTFATARRINRSNKELVGLQETFADQLKERTLELEAANQALRQEITERRQAERYLADSEQRLSDIIDFLPDPTWVIDRQGCVIAWNRAMERVSGIDKQDIIGTGDYAYAVPFYGKPRPVLIDLALERDPHWEKGYLSLKEENGVLIASESFHPAMGQGGRYFASTASQLCDTEGRVVGAIESIREVTEEKRAEQNRKKLIKELQDAIAKVKTLSGMLPICASCKKIRDDQGYWKQIESFIREHSDADFSHGICPDCADKLYPGFKDFKRKQ